MKFTSTAFLTLVVFAANGLAGFSIDFHSVSIDNDQKIANFRLGFTMAPDFWTTNGAGFQANSFQYLIDADKSPSYPGDTGIESVIRGEEIHSFGMIPIRDMIGPSPADPGSGGYGLIRGISAFNITDKLLTFSVDLNVLGDPDGQFSYALMLTEYGQMTDWLYSDNPYKPFHTIPTPSAILLASIGLFAVRFIKKKV